jgi:serine/threonine-protein kinase
LELKLLERSESTLLVGYPLLIAASGLWWRVKMVWVTTVLAIAGYAALYLDSSISWQAGVLRWQSPEQLRYPNIFLAGLLLTGYIVARQVRRILALGRYYENRPAV